MPKSKTDAALNGAVADDDATAPAIPKDSDQTRTKLPFNLTPAPAVKPRHSDPIDLGIYNETYTGWKVVFDLSADLSIFDLMEEAQQAEDDFKRLQAMRQWLAHCLLAWNFTKTDEAGTTVMVAQPRDGGLAHCPSDLLLPIARAFAQASRPPKKS